jgi:DNA replication protein DnaC
LKTSGRLWAGHKPGGADRNQLNCGTSDLVQRLQIARRELAFESALAKLDKYHLLILDDIVYVSKDQAETSVLFG